MQKDKSYSFHRDHFVYPAFGLLISVPGSLLLRFGLNGIGSPNTLIAFGMIAIILAVTLLAYYVRANFGQFGNDSKHQLEGLLEPVATDSKDVLNTVKTLSSETSEEIARSLSKLDATVRVLREHTDSPEQKQGFPLFGEMKRLVAASESEILVLSPPFRDDFNTKTDGRETRIEFLDSIVLRLQDKERPIKYKRLEQVSDTNRSISSCRESTSFKHCIEVFGQDDSGETCEIRQVENSSPVGYLIVDRRALVLFHQTRDELGSGSFLTTSGLIVEGKKEGEVVEFYRDRFNDLFKDGEEIDVKQLTARIDNRFIFRPIIDKWAQPEIERDFSPTVPEGKWEKLSTDLSEEEGLVDCSPRFLESVWQCGQSALLIHDQRVLCHTMMHPAMSDKIITELSARGMEVPKPFRNGNGEPRVFETCTTWTRKQSRNRGYAYKLREQLIRGMRDARLWQDGHLALAYSTGAASYWLMLKRDYTLVSWTEYAFLSSLVGWFDDDDMFLKTGYGPLVGEKTNWKPLVKPQKIEALNAPKNKSNVDGSSLESVLECSPDLCMFFWASSSFEENKDELEGSLRELFKNQLHDWRDLLRATFRADPGKA